VFIAPAPVAAVATPDASIDLGVAARIFGAAPAGSPAASASGLRLKGVVAPTPGTAASAIFSTGAGRDVAVYLDGEVKPGMKLVEVEPDHVIVSRDGERERIDLEAPHSTAAPTRGPGRTAAGFRLNVAKSSEGNFSLSRKELDQALRDPGQLNYLGQIGLQPGGGVRMDAAPNGSLAQKLGLLPGDVIRRVNGQAIASSGDLARLYQQFATLSLVQAEVQRGGAMVQLSYAIQP
jgi:general secretion pathway protein C